MGRQIKTPCCNIGDKPERPKRSARVRWKHVSAVGEPYDCQSCHCNKKCRCSAPPPQQSVPEPGHKPSRNRNQRDQPQPRCLLLLQRFVGVPERICRSLVQSQLGQKRKDLLLNCPGHSGRAFPYIDIQFGANAEFRQINARLNRKTSSRCHAPVIVRF